ncbi:hypothetical protein SUGI_1202470 [Cryptomeria japonica]|uniref:probable fatty acyl-CoA reductase 4 n=1 Tax=Cryptomeria japonica TaxID=3369 RepID=UPI002414BE79|nr:probable fatty acyl-CoA reductase 4 [Cryptomeria japonica]GLJ56005.1 hypothetical protein SUGI_1202470 [Cryptomeria japonica]
MASNIVEFLKHKNILVTGSTGFLAKVFIEKILRVQPSVGTLFVLIRAPDVTAAKARLHKEIIDKELFKVLREQHGHEYNEFMLQKLVPVVGDTSIHNLGISERSVREHLWETLDVIVNTAATTNFDERYDTALGVNTMAVNNFLEFGKRCRKLQVLVHVSTAFVAGEKSGVIPEKSLQMGETLVDDTHLTLDIQTELNLAKKSLDGIQNSFVPTPKNSTDQMRKLGLERARKYGWPNTYTFTKAMGEMILGERRGELPIVIIRPSIIESTFADPFPGWMEGSRTIDTIIIGYGNGRLTSFLANPNLILDVIPADFVVNAMIAAMVKHALDFNSLSIYNVSSSTANPLNYSVLVDIGYQYFLNNPCMGKDGKLIKVEKIYLLESMESFVRYMRLRYKIPLQIMGVANELLCQAFAERYNQQFKRFNFVMYLAELYKPYAFFQGRFDNFNTEHMFMGLSDYDREIFNFDVKKISWPYYLNSIHIPGVMKYVAEGQGETKD